MVSIGDVDRFLRERLIGQFGVVEPILDYIEVGLAGLHPRTRPVVSALLVGPPASGKTLFARLLAEALHGDPDKVLVVDCGSYQSEHEKARLLGAPPGYIGHRETNPVITQTKLHSQTSQRCRLSIVLLDEFEKAHRDLQNLLLGVLEDGIMYLGDGTNVKFGDSIVLFTSNVGSASLERESKRPFGFGGVAGGDPYTLSRLEPHMRRSFTPEFRSRLDVVSVFRHLTGAERRRIVRLELRKLQRHLTYRQACTNLQWSKAVEDWVATKAGSDARSIRRVIFSDLMVHIARLTSVCAGSTIRLSVRGGDISITKAARRVEKAVA